jgi:uncharacterized protein (DUF952 family)
MSRVLHLAEQPAWSAAKSAGAYERSTRGLSLGEVGFVHTSTAAQLPGVAERFYADAGPLVVLAVDVPACELGGSPVRWDDVDGDLYPHVYGPIPVAAVVAELPASFGPDGNFVLPDLTGLDIATGPARREG